MDKSPFVYLEDAIADKIRKDLKIEVVTIPEDSQLVQKSDQYLTISWEKITDLTEVSVSVNEVKAVYGFSVEFKNLRHTGKVKDVLWAAITSLFKYQPYVQFTPLELVNGGYVGYNQAIAFIKYSAQFSTSLLWNKDEPLDLIAYPSNPYIQTEIDLSLWTSATLPSIENAAQLISLP